MLLLWCLSMIQVFSYPLNESTFHLFIDLKQAIASVSGRLSPHNFEMFSISPQQAYPFVVVNPATPFSISCKRALSRSSFPPFIPFHYFISSGGIVMLCSSPITSFCQVHVLFLLIHLTGVSCFHSSSLISSSFPSFLNWRAI